MVEVYTDGSCHTQLCIGAWASVILIEGKQINLSGKQDETTHNRMEILAVIKSLRYILENYQTVKELKIISDSQYVIGLVNRQSKFTKSNYKTRAGNDIRNLDLVKELLHLLSFIKVQFEKIKAHQKTTGIVNYNSVVDKHCRQIVRDEVNVRTKKFT